LSQGIGIMGGTFDPIHYGHLVIAEAARYQLGLERVIFVPAARPPHKRRAGGDGEQRAHLTELAIGGNPYFQLSRIELERQGYSYSVDTVKAFQEQYGPGAALWFITGADMILSIRTWMRAEELRQLCRFAAAPRPGFDLAKLEQLPPEWRERIRILDAPLLEISGSEIRRRVAAGEPIRYLVPENVENYILRQGLYE